MDDYEGQLRDPRSLHKYVFGQSDPVDRRDPSGQDSLAETAIAQLTYGIIAGISVSALGGLSLGGLAYHYLPKGA